MKNYDKSFLALVDEFSKNEAIEGIILSGSRTSGNMDSNSDYDIYIYSEEKICIDFRKKILEKFLYNFELDNKIWEDEDQGFFKDNNIQIDIIFRNLSWIENILENTLIQHQASTGYSTCFWSNIINSDILYDKNGKLEELKKKYDIDYPHNLVSNIVNKNFPPLKDIISSYSNQIQKALERDDYISVNHRISAFLASYFDIIFAINKKPHPGEKKLLKISNKLSYIPKNMEEDITELLKNMYNKDFNIINKINKISQNLETLLVENKILKDWK